MWPKMLIDLLPHLARLVPMWDKFLSSRAANDKAAESAVASVVAATDGMRQNLAEVTAAHASLYRQIQEQGAKTSEHIAALEQELQYARIVIERLEAAVRQSEMRLGSLIGWVKGGILATIGLLMALLALLFHRGV